MPGAKDIEPKAEPSETTAVEKPVDAKEASLCKSSPELTDEEYWEENLFISRGPAGWNIGCGCG